MSIRFVPNDPRASKFNVARIQASRKNRSARQAGLRFLNLPSESRYPVGGLDWLQWQVREATLASLETFEQIDVPLKKWARSIRPKILEVNCNAGVQVNAYYDGDNLTFFRASKSGKVHYTGASTDVVAHEVGHAVLDALRPELWDVEFTEVAAFHEAFGDCLALLTSLSDRQIRKDLVDNDLIGKKNFLETWGEQLAWLAGPGNRPRQALNKLKWKLPDSSDEPHDFSQIFTGCFYDVIRLQFEVSKRKTEAALWEIAKTVARLLFAAARTAPITPRFFQSVGRVMALEAKSDPALWDAVNMAFGLHDIPLGSSAMISPRAKIAGSVARKSANVWKLSAPAEAELRSRFGAVSDTQLQVRPVNFGGQVLGEATYPRTVDIQVLGTILEGVETDVPETILIGRIPDDARNALAIMSAAPDTQSIQTEVDDFVAGLWQRQQIQQVSGPIGRRSAVIDPSKKQAAPIARLQIKAIATQAAEGVTHVILEQEGGTRTLRRIRFVCGCCYERSRVKAPI